MVRAGPESNLDDRRASRRLGHGWREHGGIVLRKAILVSWLCWGGMGLWSAVRAKNEAYFH